MAKKLTAITTLLVSALTSSAALSNDTAGLALGFDVGYESKYVSEGRNNLADGGIAWSHIAVSQGDVSAYAALGRGTSEHYIEWQFGVEYALNLHEHLDTSLGYQRLEFYGDERASDNELFASMTYTGNQWLEPGIHYTYATEAGGYFVEVSLHHHWPVNDVLQISPYIIQGFDFQYATETHNGVNQFQFGVEATYQLADNLALSGHISHSLAQTDIKDEQANSVENDLDQTFAGLYINLAW